MLCIVAFDDEYSSVPLTFETMSVKKVYFWRTRYILEARRADGKPYPARAVARGFELGGGVWRVKLPSDIGQIFRLF